MLSTQRSSSQPQPSKRASADVFGARGRSSVRLNMLSSFTSSLGKGKYKRVKAAVDLVESLESYERELRTGAETKYRSPPLKTDERITFDAENIICKGKKTYMYTSFPYLDEERIKDEEASCRKQMRNSKSKSARSSFGSAREVKLEEAALQKEQPTPLVIAELAARETHIKRWTMQALRTVDEIVVSKALAEQAYALRGVSPSAWTLFTVQQIIGAWFSCVIQFMQLSSRPRRALLQADATIQRMWNENMNVDEASYRAMLIGCEIGGLSFAADAFRLFRTMQASGIEASAITYGCFTSAIGASSGHSPNRPSRKVMARRRWARVRLIVALIIAFMRAGRTSRACRLRRVASGRILSPLQKSANRKSVVGRAEQGGDEDGSISSDASLPVAPPMRRLRRAESAKTIHSYLSGTSKSPQIAAMPPVQPPSLIDSSGLFDQCMYESVYDILGFQLAPRARSTSAARAFERGRGLSLASARSSSRRLSMRRLSGAGAPSPARLSGRLIVTCLRASGLKRPRASSADLFQNSGKQSDPYVEGTLEPGGVTSSTGVCRGGGSYPSWTQDEVDGVMSFPLDVADTESVSMSLRRLKKVVLEEETVVASGSLNVASALAQTNVSSHYTLPLRSSDEDGGELEVIVEFQEEAAVLPRLSISLGGVNVSEITSNVATSPASAKSAGVPSNAEATPSTPEKFEFEAPDIGVAKTSIILMWSQCRCLGCFTDMLDEEIMGAWTPENQYKVEVVCPSCGNSAVPTLHFRTMDPGSVACSKSRLGRFTGPGPFEGAWEYLSPLMVRSSFEKLIATKGCKGTRRDDLRWDNPALYWNMLWYCCRLGLTFPLLDGHQEGARASSHHDPLDEQIVIGQNYMALYELVVNEQYAHLDLKPVRDVHSPRITSMRSLPAHSSSFDERDELEDDDYVFAEAAAAAAVAAAHRKVLISPASRHRRSATP